MTRNHKPEYLGTRDFMLRFGFKSKSSLYNKAKAGLIPGASKPDTRWMFEVNEYADFVKQHEVHSEVYTPSAPEPGRRITAKPGRRKS